MQKLEKTSIFYIVLPMKIPLMGLSLQIKKSHLLTEPARISSIRLHQERLIPSLILVISGMTRKSQIKKKISSATMKSVPDGIRSLITTWRRQSVFMTIFQISPMKESKYQRFTSWLQILSQGSIRNTIFPLKLETSNDSLLRASHQTVPFLM